MSSIKIVTSLITFEGTILLLKRSSTVRSMPNLWSAVSGIIEGDEDILDRARTEIYEETGIVKKDIVLKKTIEPLLVDSLKYEQSWQIYPFLFETKTNKVALNWENSQFRWIAPNEISHYDTVPDLGRVFGALL